MEEGTSKGGLPHALKLVRGHILVQEPTGLVGAEPAHQFRPKRHLGPTNATWPS